MDHAYSYSMIHRMKLAARSTPAVINDLPNFDIHSRSCNNDRSIYTNEMVEAGRPAVRSGSNLDLEFF